MKYRKKPVVIEAIRFTGDNGQEIAKFTDDYVVLDRILGYEVFDRLHTTWVKFNQGDWIIKGVKGEFYPCVDTVFQESYEEVV